MTTIQEDPPISKKYSVMAQVLNNPSDRALEMFIREVGINYKIPEDSMVKEHKPYLIGFTILHFALTLEENRNHIIDFLLKHSADVTIKNVYGISPLRQVIEESERNQYKRCLDLKGKLQHSLANKFLNLQLESDISTNPACNQGISHFHIACMMNHKSAVKFFLKTGVDVNSKVLMNSSYLPGYTALHIAARYSSEDVTEILLNFGADVTSKDAQGMTPLQLLVARNMEIMDALITDLNIDRHKFFMNEFYSNNHIINSIVKKMNVNQPNFIDEIGLSYFHIACIQKDDSSIQQSCNANIINSSISLDSHFLPGYTPLHFAAHFSCETVKLLVRNGANVIAKDKNGITPLDLCVERYELKDIHWIFSNHKSLQNILLSDNSKLTDTLLAMTKQEKFKKFLSKKSKSVSVSLDSPLLPGYNLLHLAILFEKKSTRSKAVELYKDSEYDYFPFIAAKQDLVLSLVLKNDNVITPNCDGMTPIHLALRQQKNDIVKTCLKYNLKKAVNVTDPEDLSHFHIACAANNYSLVKQFLDNGVNVSWPIESCFSWKDEKSSDEMFIQRGSTPLHISVACQRKHITELLLKHGAEPFKKNVDGLTSVHLAFTRPCNKNMINVLLAASGMDTVNPKTCEGLSHLHIACYVNNLSAVKALLKIDPDINSCIKRVLKSTYAENPNALKGVDYYTNNVDRSNSFIFLSPYAGYTPLHFAAETFAFETMEFLVQNGANIHAKNSLGLSPLHLVLKSESKKLDECLKVLCSKLQLKSDKFIDDTNMTLIHLACRTFDENRVQNLLNLGADVNARINSESPIWPGNTPLHIVVCFQDDRNKDKAVRIVKLLLKNGADITIKNEENLTPLFATDQDSLRKLMLGSQTTFNSNPTNHEGFSHFHLACLFGDASVVEEFLKKGVNVNLPNDFFSELFAGYSPLHFAVKNDFNYKEIIKILLDYKADIHAENTKGLTSFLNICELNNVDYLSDILKRIDCNDINKKNIFGYTPLLWMIENYKVAEKNITLFLKNGAWVNLFSPKNLFGCLAIAMWERSEEIFRDIMNNAIDLTSINDDGFNAIHNIVSYSPDLSDLYNSNHLNRYQMAIEQLILKGCKINGQSRKGRTPLHLAFEFKNPVAITALLKVGADINIVDFFNDTPYSHFSCDSITCANIFKEHISLLIHYGLEVSNQNMAHYKCLRPAKVSDACVQEYIQMSRTCIDDEGGSFNVSYVLSENMVALYYKTQRRIDRFFNSVNISFDYPNLGRLLYLQYRKALDRKELIKPAKNSLMTLYGLPDVCNVLVLEYLTNSDLTNLIAAKAADSSHNRRTDEAQSKDINHGYKRFKVE